MQKMIGYDTKPLKISFIVVSFISSFFMPFVFVILLHDVFHFSKSHWFFRAPFSAYILGFSGLFLLSMFLTLDEMIRSKREDTGKSTGPWLILLSFIISVTCYVYAANNYYFFDDKGLHYNKTFELSQRDLNWDDFSKVEQIVTRENNMEVYKEHIFITKSGEEFVIPYEPEFRDHRSKILYLVERTNTPIVERFVESE
ncbi:hypothetical protein [Pontibacillus marinus]|uniref:Uncharacterized protein n=1 Tax=Pontibacillus marinus BH030004 = DSM 16465 TaxID=1385511 RepID=A0A0A5G1N2_9BACI|nr:hypothetical protein [Pontibacillus marinus]KGX86986.1 hypothetical protein N783_10655 [Pontibacillus marinus BH030004 = DSM 16465]